MDITGKTAIVTGSARGIGRGIALVLASNGADVVVADILEQGAREAAAEVEALGRKAMAHVVDVTDQSSVNRMVRETLDRFGRIDIVVNNAGTVAAPGWENREESNEDDWDDIYAVNVKGIVKVMDAVADHMKERRYGRIINIASVAGRQGYALNPPYCVSKAGVISLTQSKAQELAPYSITVNAICPGLIWTHMWERIATRLTNISADYKEMTPRQAFDRTVEGRTPLMCEQSPEDTGHLAAFLASDLASNITGQAINVDGGSRMN
jgi:meso-butanediol dehydrogenase/(S,S)-butanediol dehydrogenase/diacetyl reductase